MTGSPSTCRMACRRRAIYGENYLDVRMGRQSQTSPPGRSALAPYEEALSSGEWHNSRLKCERGGESLPRPSLNTGTSEGITRPCRSSARS